MTGSNSKPDLKALQMFDIVNLQGIQRISEAYSLEGGRIDGDTEVNDGHAG